MWITANCSTEGTDRKSAVLGRFQRIPGISVTPRANPAEARVDLPEWKADGS
jgi:hypothetical protein